MRVSRALLPFTYMGRRGDSAGGGAPQVIRSGGLAEERREECARFVFDIRKGDAEIQALARGKRFEGEVADGAVVARRLRLPSVVRCLTNSRRRRLVVMDSLHREEGHERCQEQPCDPYSAFGTCLHLLSFLYLSAGACI